MSQALHIDDWFHCFDESEVSIDLGVLAGGASGASVWSLQVDMLYKGSIEVKYAQQEKGNTYEYPERE